MTFQKIIRLFGALAMAAACAAGLYYYFTYVMPPDKTPTQVTEAYFTAVKGKEYEKAFAFVSRRHYPDSFNQFKDRVDMYSPDMRLEITGESITGDTAIVDARVLVPMTFGPYTSETRMRLVRKKREWQIMHP